MPPDDLARPPLDAPRGPEWGLPTTPADVVSRRAQWKSENEATQSAIDRRWREENGAQ